MNLPAVLLGGRRKRAGRVGRVLALSWLALVVGTALLAPLLPLPNPDAIDLSQISAPPSWSHVLGTDSLGRDQLSRVIYGSQITLLVSVGAVLGALVVGVTLGVIAGYFRGTVDRAISWIVDVLLAFPPLVLAVALAAVLGANLANVAIAIGIIVVPSFARIARASTVQVAQREYVLVARSLGAGNTRIIVREIVPNVLQAVLTLAITLVGLVVIIEGGLSFLGLGVPLPRPTWGGMIQAGQAQIFINPSEVLVPSVVLFATVLALNLVSEDLSARFGLSGVKS